ncbi:MAG TPA: DUF1778 domain-containing protein [Hyphomicrobiaceae bacterium]|jgi:uncharacterized protein (DUF1778 family)
MTDDVTREANIHIRARTADRDLIDRAAAQLGKSRSEFVMDTMRREAQEVLLDQTVFRVDAKTFKAFLAELDRPPRDNPRLRALLQRKPAWES